MEEIKPGFYANVDVDKNIIQLGFSIGYSSYQREFCIWIHLFVVNIYVGYRRK